MGFVISGKMLLVGFMMAVMGYPLAFYLRRDRAYEATAGQPDSVRLAAWYEC